tara:strand:- start:12444 stop:13721 length:1278 start_codon:yes stop_codon:yes gene_type:complete
VTKKNSIEVINTNARDSKIKDTFFDVKKDIFKKGRLNLKSDEYICICSGGTTSGCAKNDFITLDLRRNYNQISHNKHKEIAVVGGGVLMKDLSNKLEADEYIFPMGLSNLPGMGYVLTGGVSPLSRRYGLAIDNIEFIKGYLGDSSYFSLYKNELNTKNEIYLWEALRGAAPFLSIITEIGLKTIKSYPIQLFEGFINQIELKEIIEMAESFPQNMSLQWIFTEKIYIYIVAEIKNEEDKINNENYLKIFHKYSLANKFYKSFNHIKFFPAELGIFELNLNYHSEVISLLGDDLNNNVGEFIRIISEINNNKPNKSCYIACQQLGENTKTDNNSPSLFVHRNSSWKPWIFTSWERNNLEQQEISIRWMIDSWCKLKLLFPNIHLAQLHNHLDSHQEELSRAFDNKLNKLKILKNFCDPSGILPPL